MRELESPQSLMEQEQAIRDVILSRLHAVNLVAPAQQEAVAYRLAEIFVASRQLYTHILPRFLEAPTEAANPPPASKADPVAPPEDASATGPDLFEVFGEVRMNLLMLRDLVEDFEETFLASLSDSLESPTPRVGEEEDSSDEDHDEI